MILSDKINRLISALSSEGIAAERNVPLSRHTTFRIGGDAAVGIFPTDEGEALTALRLLHEFAVPLYVIGGGSNLLAPDAGFQGAVLFTERMDGINFTGREDGSVAVSAMAGVPLSLLARRACEQELTGAEFLYGIPGTVGGAVVMNAGAYGGEISQILASSRYTSTETPSFAERTNAEHDYGYRRSVYTAHPKELVLSATFVLRRGDREAIEGRMKELISCRREKQPLEFPSAGSFFKRPVGAFAGKLIEDTGLKGYRIGGAEVSEKHAGFIVNRGNATEANVRALAAFVRETVLRETGYLLESEVRVMEGEAL